jgi:hypothetical protein
MVGRMTLAAGLLALGALAAPRGSLAAPSTQMPSVGAKDSRLVEIVQWHGCRYWRHECARRWGWGGWRWRRCPALHGCL